MKNVDPAIMQPALEFSQHTEFRKNINPNPKKIAAIIIVTFGTRIRNATLSKPGKHYLISRYGALAFMSFSNCLFEIKIFIICSMLNAALPNGKFVKKYFLVVKLAQYFVCEEDRKLASYCKQEI